MTIEEKHLQAITNNVREISAWEAEGIEGQDLASKECAKITLQYCIDVLENMRWKWMVVNADAYHDARYKILELQKQLSDLNK